MFLDKKPPDNDDDFIDYHDNDNTYNFYDFDVDNNDDVNVEVNGDFYDMIIMIRWSWWWLCFW